MSSSQVNSQIPARCLFPDSSETQVKSQVRPSIPFSIGDIMKSVGLPVQEHDSTPTITTSKTQSVPEITRKDTQLSKTTVSTQRRPQGLQLSDLLHNHSVADDSLQRTNAKPHNPFLSFLDRPSSNTSRCGTPPPPVPLSLQHLQSFPELSPGLPSPFQALVSPSLPSTCPVSSSLVNPTPMPNTVLTSDKSRSPTSDISEDLIDVESTSPSGSSTSSGFGSNPSPTPSPTALSPTDSSTEVPANQRTAYSQKQSSRLKQVFQQNRYPDVEMYEELSEELKIPIQRLRVWFQNRRARNKRSASDQRMMMTYPPHVPPMMSSAPGYGYTAPMMHQSVYQYPVSPAYPMYPPPSMYPGYSYPFQYQH